MNKIYIIIATALLGINVHAYRELFPFKSNRSESSQFCSVFQEKMRLRLVTPHPHFRGISREPGHHHLSYLPRTTSYYRQHVTQETLKESVIDPLDRLADTVDDILLGDIDIRAPKTSNEEKATKMLEKDKLPEDPLLQYPSGSIMRAERFAGHSAVHLSCMGGYQRGHAALRLTPDYMQTAVDAFFFFIEASLEDVLRLPADYVLRSARTIAMMQLNLGKLSATWQVVKGQWKDEEVPYEVLELYRPLFKYLSPREIASLNLTNDKIMTYIGTHPDLGRHQVGAVASRYMKLNPKWSEAQYLNLMSNVMCGIPITIMRKLEPNVFLQLNHQVFFHIRACDPLQRRFYLSMMTKTRVLGKPYSWTPRDVTRLGLLIPYMKCRDINSISPDAMAGITAQVIVEMTPEKLKCITDVQIKYLEEKSYNIFVRKMKEYKYDRKINKSPKYMSSFTLVLAAVVIVY